MSARPDINLNGVEIFPGFLGAAQQREIVEELRRITRAAPFAAQQTPMGKPMSVRMTSAGKYGWVSDRSGYRYSERQQGGEAWPPIPKAILDIWAESSGIERQPDCCLINFYGEGARMGLHQDKDEASFEWPVVSVSLGDDGLFRVGNVTRGSKTQSIWLRSGDVAVMGGAARMVYHGVDRIRFGSSTLLPKGGRINLTMRVVD